ncbi:SPFH domain-containing protein [Breznakiella homolactica]|uniref:SPFH domain-containing protein n=1 Tax=Breznakiella homolactica TaxID=2798577 RepID=A0A7T7XK28_9SPIR|nr:SPFH domain-containing protein [Breznakiella homolactica]QQO07826.1 SPFH domain-containing protein [Breznakiella homolactica]
MGIIKAAVGSIGGTLADQWKDVIKADSMTNATLITRGVQYRKNDKRNSNTKGSDGVITDGSLIHVEENQFMLLTDGGKIIDYSAEPGYFTVNTGTAPSLFNGQADEAIMVAFKRFQFGGISPKAMRVYFVNTQEIRDIPFGTQSPVNYFDNFYNAELSLRANGYYSIRIVNPLLFYAEMAPRDGSPLLIKDLQKLCLSEFLTCFQTAIGQLSVQGERISHISAKTSELARTMAAILDDDWTNRRGFVIESVGINSITYDDESRKLIAMRNQGGMLGDPGVRNGYVQGAAARGIEAAGSNPGGAGMAFMGMNAAMGQGGAFVSAAGETNRQTAERSPAKNTTSWTCPECRTETDGNFCSNCGTKKPSSLFCSECGNKADPGAKFCPNCGSKLT